MKMKREFIEGMKCLGSIAAILLQGALESMANTYEENREEYQTYKKETLEDQWKRELYYYSDERLEQELKNCFLYNWSVDYDGRCKCIDRIAEFKARQGYKVV
jgi:hypothetical protein